MQGRERGETQGRYIEEKQRIYTGERERDRGDRSRR
jgi:hypothetical protein